MQPIAGRTRGRRLRERDPSGFGLTLASLPKPATSKSLFGNDRPLELEVGTGKGTFLVSESLRRPEINFLGVEYARRYWLTAADRLRRNRCGNARVLLAEAEIFVREFLPDESLSSVHIYFPDPWPKTRHHKRRLLTPGVVALLEARMTPGARLQIATDHREYFDQILRAIAHSTLVAASFGPTAAAGESELVGSNFERKYRKEARTLFTLAAVKRPGAS
jgi:tRNA (guanine-N7-)-methyltransferase